MALVQCFGCTKKGGRCKFVGTINKNEYGVDMVVCKKHADQNVIKGWSAWDYSYDTEPEDVRKFFKFYDMCLGWFKCNRKLALCITSQLFKEEYVYKNAEPEDFILAFIEKVLKPIDSGECSICYECDGPNCVTHCGHVYCTMCITKWIFKSPTCPMCRKNISKYI